MALTTSSHVLAPGAPAPDFLLPRPGEDGKLHGPGDFAGRPLLVVFACNHCPYVVHLADALGNLLRERAASGLACLAINPNDASRYPDDAPERMTPFARAHRWDFPYLHDADQEVAHAYHAACTPDFFLFDASHRLFYSGQFDSSRPGHGTPTGDDLRAALAALVAGNAAPIRPPSAGCSIKWKHAS